MLEQCTLHPVMEKATQKISQDLEKIIVGMYGALDNPNSGFIHSVKNDLDDLKESMESVKKIFNSTILTVSGGIITIATAAAVAAVNGWFK